MKKKEPLVKKTGFVLNLISQYGSSIKIVISLMMVFILVSCSEDWHLGKTLNYPDQPQFDYERWLNEKGNLIDSLRLEIEKSNHYEEINRVMNNWRESENPQKYWSKIYNENWVDSILLSLEYGNPTYGSFMSYAIIGTRDGYKLVRPQLFEHSNPEYKNIESGKAKEILNKIDSIYGIFNMKSDLSSPTNDPSITFIDVSFNNRKTSLIEYSIVFPDSANMAAFIDYFMPLFDAKGTSEAKWPKRH
jgi:hypothetical protein